MPRTHEQAALFEQITAPIGRFGFGANNVGQGEAIIGNLGAEAVATVNTARDKVLGKAKVARNAWKSGLRSAVRAEMHEL